jgi:probable F420-dependent oxidoreductase
VEFGFSLPGRGPLASPEQILRLATRAEALRYTSVFVTDHVVLPASMARSVYPYAATGRLPGGADQDYLDPLALLGWLAHATRTIKLGTSVLVVPYRNPLVTAKILATIDRLSNGRLLLGMGVGWLREEFEALAAPPFEERGQVTDEYIALMRTTWTTDPVSFEGRYYRVKDVHALPKPAQTRGIPIWIGGHTDAAVRRAATVGDGWHPLALRPPGLLLPDEFATKVALFRSTAERAGRNPDTLTLSLRVGMAVRSSRDKAPGGDRSLFQGTAAEVLEDINRYVALGVSHFVFDPVVPDLKLVLASMDRFANEVRPKVVSRQKTAAGRARHQTTRRRSARA